MNLNLSKKKSLIIILLTFTLLLTMVLPISARGYVSTKETNLNVRNSPSITAEIIASLPQNAYVELISYTFEDGWWYLEYEKGKYGYCFSEYITELYSQPIFIQNGYYSAVELDIIDYKQYDPKWGKLQVGYSGENIHNIGCALTCVAMLESYRTEKKITPKDVLNKFSFTPGGAIYWTADYSVNWSDDYLKTIYYELTQGNPVMIESKNQKNTSHWVVITGFTGGDILSADKFTINDPGSSKRKLLSDFFDMYPSYSKFVQLSSY